MAKWCITVFWSIIIYSISHEICTWSCFILWYFIWQLRLQYLKYLSHPSLGWLYVFSSFPPRPPPQQLLPLTSKLFELNLRYLAQRIYGSGEMYWMTFLWPWPKVTAVASISKNLLVCAIKWEPRIRSLQNITGLLPWSWLLPDSILERFCWKLYFGKFSFKISDVFFQGQTLFWPYLRNGWSDWCETKRKCIGWILGTICDLDLWPHS